MEGPGQRTAPRKVPPLRPFAGLALVGYGLLVLVKVLPHDSPRWGWIALALGLGLVAGRLPRVAAPRARLVALLGMVAVLGVVAYNVVVESGLSVPEWGILVYGCALVAAAPFLARRIGRAQVASLVGWSFPLVLAPLALFALNATLSDESTGAAASPIVRGLIVLPTAAALRLFGTPIEVVGSNLVLPTPRGSLTLGVGLVCAGLYPILLFAGLAGLYAWQHRVARRRLALSLGLGIIGLWIVNILRLVLLSKIGQANGAGALQEAHANLGWILFAAYMTLFWWIVFRLQPPESNPAAQPGG